MKVYLMKTISFDGREQHMSDGEKTKVKFELRALQMVLHPYIIAPRQSWFDKTSKLFKIMEYCELGDLGKWLRETQPDLSADRILTMFTQLILALEQSHSQKVVHRNMSDTHILVKDTGDE